MQDVRSVKSKRLEKKRSESEKTDVQPIGRVSFLYGVNSERIVRVGAV